ncbi:hypothetical protein MSG28_012676 [Choristoneura fumiferana]|uniref:Uncharacterized protein n=1 Tax=Choristoneura fumiferana TaxID=7141 RepID=A0ACC0JHH1_CHOFU|nr:hypothetical protein MSG28_012676 [Choristoneura fumiferana]
MSVQSGMSQNHDREGSKNYNLSVAHGEPGNSISGGAFVNSLTDGGAYKSFGGNVAAEKSGFGGSLSAVHTHGGNQATASASMNLMKTENHKVGVNTFATSTMPKNGSNFVTHGGGVDYSYKNTLGATASVSHTPMFKQTDYKVGAGLNLHQTPSSAVNLNLGASRTDFPNHRGNWQKGMLFNVRKDF